MFKDPNFVETYWVESQKVEPEGNVEQKQEACPNVIEMSQNMHAYGDQIKQMKFDKNLLKIDCKGYYP